MLIIHNDKGDRKKVHPIDLQGWLKEGWSTSLRTNDNSVLPPAVESRNSEELEETQKPDKASRKSKTRNTDTPGT